MEGRKWSYEQSHKEEEKEGGSGTGEGAMAPSAEEGWLYLDILVPSYAIADGACLPT